MFGLALLGWWLGLVEFVQHGGAEGIQGAGHCLRGHDRIQKDVYIMLICLLE